jgi:hypothetical protein
MATKKNPNPLIPETEFKDFVRQVISKGDRPKPVPETPKKPGRKGLKPN